MNESWTKIYQAFPEANFLQSPLWAEANRLMGHKLVVRTFDNKAMYLGIVKDARRGRYLEIPGGPLVNWSDRKTLKIVFESIIEEARKEKCVFVRFRPQIYNTPENEKLVMKLKTEIKGLDLRSAPMHLHAQNTIILDLKKTEEELLMSMRRQTRYEVRRSDKLELKVIEDTSEEAFKEFHSVQAETAKRQNFIPPSEKELFAERDAFSPDRLKLYKVLDANEKPVAYGLVLIYGKEAEYFEAASTDLNRKLPGAYALLWRAIKDLKAMNIERFNLWGIAPPGVEHHRYSGVTTFKTGFGGEIVEFIPAKDIIINKLKYKFDEIVETARKKKRNL
ncbi:peptidoglycan bridge formation glycyltransferase FemA/FemB family protein [Candidatus Saccharibacteria bacterium]|nr:peptidoglycan bridge formation glycyltransferase FemA/FemB family protein [Candidatus Saccharibacteria bacterium]